MSRKRVIISIIMMCVLILSYFYESYYSKVFMRNFGMGIFQTYVSVILFKLMPILASILVAITVFCRVRFDNISKVYIIGVVGFILVFLILFLVSVSFIPRLYLIFNDLSLLLNICGFVIGIYLNPMLDR